MVSFSPFIHLMVRLMRFSFCDGLQPFQNAINQYLSLTYTKSMICGMLFYFDNYFKTTFEIWM